MVEKGEKGRKRERDGKREKGKKEEGRKEREDSFNSIDCLQLPFDERNSLLLSLSLSTFPSISLFLS